MYDAVTLFARAISAALDAGHDVYDPRTVQDNLRSLPAFEGLTGQVALGRDGERGTEWSVANARVDAGGSTLSVATVGTWSARRALDLTQPVIFAGGATVPPIDVFPPQQPNPVGLHNATISSVVVSFEIPNLRHGTLSAAEVELQNHNGTWRLAMTVALSILRAPQPTTELRDLSPGTPYAIRWRVQTEGGYSERVRIPKLKLHTLTCH